MIPASSPRTLTISIPRTAISHALIGLALAALAVGALTLHAHLPGSTPYRGALLAGGVIAGIVAGIYWLWCSLRGVRAAQAATLEALQAQEERDRAAAARSSAILNAFEEAHRDHKEHMDKLDELLGAIEALQDCYIDKGRADGRPREHP